MDPEERSRYVTSGGLHALTDPADWAESRLVLIDSGTGTPVPVLYADNLERDQEGNPALVLRSYLPWSSDPEDAAPTVVIWLLEWALRPGVAPFPDSTAHRSEIGARARVVAVAEDRGWALGAETVRPNGSVMGNFAEGMWLLSTRELPAD